MRYYRQNALKSKAIIMNKYLNYKMKDEIGQSIVLISGKYFTLYEKCTNKINDNVIYFMTIGRKT